MDVRFIRRSPGEWLEQTHRLLIVSVGLYAVNVRLTSIRSSATNTRIRLYAGIELSGAYLHA